MDFKDSEGKIDIRFKAVLVAVLIMFLTFAIVLMIVHKAKENKTEAVQDTNIQIALINEEINGLDMELDIVHKGLNEVRNQKVITEEDVKNIASDVLVKKGECVKVAVSGQSEYAYFCQG